MKRVLGTLCALLICVALIAVLSPLAASADAGEAELISGTITGKVVLGKGEYIACNDLTVAPGGSLTIGSGSTVYLSSNYSENYGYVQTDQRICSSIKVSGELICDNVTFTGYLGTRWYGIEFSDRKNGCVPTGRFKDCTFTNGGADSGFGSGYILYSGSNYSEDVTESRLELTVEACAFVQPVSNYTGGIVIRDGVHPINGSVTISQCSFIGVGHALYMAAGCATDASLLKVTVSDNLFQNIFSRQSSNNAAFSDTVVVACYETCTLSITNNSFDGYGDKPTEDQAARQNRAIYVNGKHGAVELTVEGNVINAGSYQTVAPICVGANDRINAGGRDYAPNVYKNLPDALCYVELAAPNASDDIAVWGQTGYDYYMSSAFGIGKYDYTAQTYGGGLVIKPGVGVRLAVKSGIALYIKSALTAVGTESSPIRIYADAPTSNSGQLQLDNTSNVALEYVEFSNTYRGIYAGSCAGELSIRNCTFTDTYETPLLLKSQYGNVTVSGCTFNGCLKAGASASGEYGALLALDWNYHCEQPEGVSAVVENCTFAGNGHCTAVYVTGFARNLTIKGCYISNCWNGIYARCYDLELPATAVSHCTIANNANFALDLGAKFTVKDSILRSNAGGTLALASGASAAITSCCLPADDVALGSGCISSDPYFVSASDLRIHSYSKCVKSASDGTDIGAYQIASARFSDVEPGVWFEADMMAAVRQGLIIGTGNGKYSPNDELSVGSAVKLAACMHQYYTVGKITLASVPGQVWYQVYVDYAVEHGLMTADKFAGKYNDMIDRVDCILLFAAALPDSALPAINTYNDGDIPDVKLSDSYGEQVYKLYRAGIINGTGTGNFDAFTKITRASVAAIINRLMDPSVRKVSK